MRGRGRGRGHERGVRVSLLSQLASPWPTFFSIASFSSPRAAD